MTAETKKRIKYVLAGIGAAYAVAALGYFVYTGVKNAQRGPSEIEAHPERQGEIRAQQRVGEMQKQLGLSDEQAQQIAAIMESHHPGGPGGPERMKAFRDEINKVLTAEQQAKFQEMRGPGGRGPGQGRPRMMDPERMKALAEKMTPEQRERLEKHMERFRQHMNGRGPGAQGGPNTNNTNPDQPPVPSAGGEGGGPDGPPPDGAGGPGDAGQPPQQ